MNNNFSSNADRNWFFFTNLFIIIDYGRPQDILPIGFLRPALIVSIILIYYIIKEGYFKRYSSKQMKYILLFIVLLALYIPFARNNFYAWRTTKSMLLYLPFILSVIATVTSVERLKRLVFVLICLMIYVSGYSFTHNGVGSGNYFSDENDLSLYINMYLPFCYFLFFYEKSTLIRSVYLTGFVVGAAGIMISFSRGGFVGLVATVMVVWLNSQRKMPSLVIILLCVGVFYLSAGVQYLGEMETISSTADSTATTRIESWKAGWRMFLDNPLGVGGNNFQVRFSEYQGDYFKRDMWGRVAHSLWFTLIPELGIPGILIYFSLLFANIKDLFFLKYSQLREDRDVQYLRVFSVSCLASFAGYFVSATFISVLYYAHYWYLVAVIVAAINIAKNQSANIGRHVNLVEQTS